MKKTILLSAFAAFAILTACNSSTNKTEQAGSTDTTQAQQPNPNQVFNLDTTKLAAGTTFYQCPMHLEVISDQPGKCPTCEMDLEKVVKS